MLIEPFLIFTNEGEISKGHLSMAFSKQDSGVLTVWPGSPAEQGENSILSLTKTHSPSPCFPTWVPTGAKMISEIKEAWWGGVTVLGLGWGVRGWTRCLKALTILAEDLGVCDGSQLFENPVLGGSDTLPDFRGHQALTWCIYIHASKHLDI